MTKMKVIGARSVRPVQALLTPHEEVRLAQAWQQRGDIEARNRLVEAFQPLAQGMASRIAKKGAQHRYHELRRDLVSEATIALMKAADKFDPEKGFRFSTYAHWWIKAALFDYVIQDHRLVKAGISGNQRTLFFNLPKVLAEIDRKNALTGCDVSFEEKIQQAADTLGIPREIVMEYSGRLLSGDLSLNTTVSSEEDGGTEWMDRLVDEGETPEGSLVRADTTLQASKVISAAMRCLSEREKDILTRRRLDPDKVWRLQELADEYSLSRERIRQIEARAVQKMHRSIVASGAPVKALIR